jgi:hypothetical protein
LVEACIQESASGERYAALGLLLELERRSDKRLSGVQRERWLAAAQGLARREYPRSHLGLRSFQVWRQCDGAGAEAFLVDELDDHSIEGEAASRTVVADLRSFGSERAMRRLEGMTSLPERVAAEREAALDIGRPPTKEGLLTLADAWRVTRSAEALSRLFLTLVRNRPEGSIRMDEVIEILGPPTRRAGEVVVRARYGWGVLDCSR